MIALLCYEFNIAESFFRQALAINRSIKDLKKVTGMIALGADYISMADTEDGLIENGFIKK